MVQHHKCKFVFKLSISIVSVVGLLLATLFMIFGFVSTFEAGTYQYLYRFIYLLALLSCLSGVLLLAWWLFDDKLDANKFNSVTKMVIVTYAIIAVLGLLTATGVMLVMFRTFLGLNEMSSSFNVEPSFAWWYLVLPLVSVFGCVMASIVFVKRVIFVNTGQ